MEPQLCIILFCFFQGKILQDDTALKEYQIDDKSFVVVMVTKVWELHLFLTEKISCFFMLTMPLKAKPELWLYSVNNCQALMSA